MKIPWILTFNTEAMARKTNALTATTRQNKIKRLEKHIKKMTFTKIKTVQENGRLVTKPICKYWGDQQALDKLKALKAV